MTDLFDLKGKVALVTGAGRGIGREIAIGLAEAGAAVVLASRTADELERVAGEVAKTGSEAIVVPTDVSKADEVSNLLKQTLDHRGKVDILINNAGSNVKKPAVEVGEKEWLNILNSNLNSCFLCSRLIGKQMIKQRKGSIVNMSSIGGKLALIGSLAYCASKGGILQMTRVLACEWAPFNVRVNAICPGYVKTELVDRAMKARSGLGEKIIQRTPMARLAEPREIVGAAVFLASDAASYVTGASITIDGGLSALGV